MDDHSFTEQIYSYVLIMPLYDGILAAVDGGGGTLWDTKSPVYGM